MSTKTGLTTSNGNTFELTLITELKTRTLGRTAIGDENAPMVWEVADMDGNHLGFLTRDIETTVTMFAGMPSTEQVTTWRSGSTKLCDGMRSKDKSAVAESLAG